MPGPSSPRPGGNRPGGASGRPSPGASGPSRNDKDNKRSPLEIVKVVGMVIVVVVGLALMGLRSCGEAGLGSILPSAGNISSGNSSQSSPLSSLFSGRGTLTEDYSHYALVQDINGIEYTTVVDIIPVNDAKISKSEIESLISGYRWYQLITVNNMGTGFQEHAYLYFPADSTFSGLASFVDALNSSGRYTGYLMTPDAYNAYVNSPDHANIYYNEATYFGPAAKS